MTIKRFITNLLALFTLFTVSLACKDSEKSIINSSFSISEEYLTQNLDKSSTSVQIPINASLELAQWSVSYEANWLQCSKQKTAAEGTFLKITVNENTGETKRTANIKVTSTTATYTITVNQYAKGEVIVEGDIKVTPTEAKRVSIRRDRILKIHMMANFQLMELPLSTLRGDNPPNSLSRWNTILKEIRK